MCIRAASDCPTWLAESPGERRVQCDRSRNNERGCDGEDDIERSSLLHAAKRKQKSFKF